VTITTFSPLKVGQRMHGSLANDYPRGTTRLEGTPDVPGDVRESADDPVAVAAGSCLALLGSWQSDLDEPRGDLTDRKNCE
jgi:hypothetical protein